MRGGKDGAEVATFMMLFARLREWIDDEPNNLEELSRNDDSIRRLCTDLWWVASSLSIAERRKSTLFAAPVDPSFIRDWRAYEARYLVAVREAFLLGFLDDLPP